MSNSPTTQPQEATPASPLAMFDGAPSLMDNPSGFAQFYTDLVIEKLVFFVPKLIVAVIILWVGTTIAAKVYRALVKHTSGSKRIDTTLGNFMSAAAKYAVLTATFLAAVSVIGIPVAKVFVILSAATLAIGLALQGSMANVAAGFLLILFRPYRIGDYVELCGEEGVVEDMNIFNTSLRTLDNINIILSNGQVRGDAIKNFTVMGVRRIDVDFGIDYDDNMDTAIKVIKETAAKHKDVLSEPSGPWAKVCNIGDSSIDVQMRVWCKSDNYWETRFDLIKDVKEAFDANGITIPYPHVVEMVKEV